MRSPSHPAKPRATREPQPLLARLMAAEMRKTELIIRNRLKSQVGLIGQVSGHLLQTQGKRFRPLLTLAGAALCDNGGKHARRLAAAVELMHSATLLHDDVVDQGKMRRGHASANVVWGNKESVLTGDFLLGRAFALMVESNSHTALKTLAHAAVEVSEGEVLQLESIGRLNLSEAEILHIAERKTAALFAAAAESGACFPADEEPSDAPARRKALRAFGHHVGMAFQLVDDAMDYESSDRVMGKAQGDDLKDSRMTLPVRLALQNASSDERRFWQRVIEKREHREEDFERARGILIEHGSLVEVRHRAKKHLRLAHARLLSFPDSQLRGALEDAVRQGDGRTR